MFLYLLVYISIHSKVVEEMVNKHPSLYTLRLKHIIHINQPNKIMHHNLKEPLFSECVTMKQHRNLCLCKWRPKKYACKRLEKVKVIKSGFNETGAEARDSDCVIEWLLMLGTADEALCQML